MVDQRLLNVPRFFFYTVNEPRASYGFRLDFINTTDATVSRPKFFLNISDMSASRVIFTFLNTAPEDYAITHVYFDDGEVMAIDVVMNPDRQVQATQPDGKDAIEGRGTSPGARHLHGNLAIIIDLRSGIGLADIICALNEERLTVSLKAVRQDWDASEIFVNQSRLALSCPSMQ